MPKIYRTTCPECRRNWTSGLSEHPPAPHRCCGPFASGWTAETQERTVLRRVRNALVVGDYVAAVAEIDEVLNG